MKRSDIEDENKKILISQYKSLNSGAPFLSLGLSAEQSEVLREMELDQVIRAASVQVPLFVFDCSSDVLERALNYSSDSICNSYASSCLFLLNRWRACENNLTAIQTFYKIDKKIYHLMKNASGSDIINAANSGLVLFRLSVHSKYLFHAGSRFDLRFCQRNKYALCASM